MSEHPLLAKNNAIDLHHLSHMDRFLYPPITFDESPFLRRRITSYLIIDLGFDSDAFYLLFSTCAERGIKINSE